MATPDQFPITKGPTTSDAGFDNNYRVIFLTSTYYRIINESINQSISQSINQFICQSINHTHSKYGKDNQQQDVELSLPVLTKTISPVSISMDLLNGDRHAQTC